MIILTTFNVNQNFQILQCVNRAVGVPHFKNYHLSPELRVLASVDKIPETAINMKHLERSSVTVS